MKHFLYFLLCTALLPVAGAAQTGGWRYSEMPEISGYQLSEIDAYGDHAAVICNSFENDGLHSAVNLNENGIWRTITDTSFKAKVSGGTVKCGLCYDKTGNLWVAPGMEGKGLLRYNGSVWDKFEIADSLSPYRSFRRMAIQPGSGQIWTLAEVEIVDTIIDGNPPIKFSRVYQELWAFDGSGFRKIALDSSSQQLNELAFSTDGRFVWTVLLYQNKLLKLDAQTGETAASYDLFFGKDLPASKRNLGDRLFLEQSADGKLWFGYSGIGFEGAASYKSGINVLDPRTGEWSSLVETSWLGGIRYNAAVNEIVYGAASYLVRLDAETGAQKNSLSLSDLKLGVTNRIESFAESNGRTWLTVPRAVVFYDPTLSVNVGEGHEAPAIFPNPVSGRTGFLRLMLPGFSDAESVEFRLYSTIGHEVLRGQLLRNGDEWQAGPGPGSPAPGAYRLSLSSGSELVTLPLVITE